jgi:hypothetical protein
MKPPSVSSCTVLVPLRLISSFHIHLRGFFSSITAQVAAAVIPPSAMSSKDKFWSSYRRHSLELKFGYVLPQARQPLVSFGYILRFWAALCCYMAHGAGGVGALTKGLLASKRLLKWSMDIGYREPIGHLLLEVLQNGGLASPWDRERERHAIGLLELDDIRTVILRTMDRDFVLFHAPIR